MFDKIMNFLGLNNDAKTTTNENKNLKENKIKQFHGIVLEKKENELIIGSNNDTSLKMRLMIVEKSLLPNMCYPSLCDKRYCSIDYKQISIRDRIILEYNNELKNDIIVPINSCNSLITIIDLDIKDRKGEEN